MTPLPGCPPTVALLRYGKIADKHIRQLDPFYQNLSVDKYVIRNRQDYDEIWQYIDSNPLRWNEDRFYEEA